MRVTPPKSPLLEAFRPDNADLAADLVGLDRPWVRDIAWLLHAPDLATIGYAGRPTLEELGLDAPEHRRLWLRRQESQTANFEARRQARRSERLGIYHETLWQWIFEHAPNTRLIAHNVVLRESRQTVGELDLLYATRPPFSSPFPSSFSSPRSLPNSSIRAGDHWHFYHAELAIKFFLGLPEGPGDEFDAARWIGIGSFDSLAIKCHRLRSHQLPRGLTPAASQRREALNANGPLQQRTIMPGFLYHPWQQRLTLPTLANPNAWQGLWCHHRDWSTLSRTLPETTRGHELIKPDWLALPTEATTSLTALSANLQTHFASSGRPKHLYLSLPDGRSCRIFVVRDDWPPALPLPPLSASPSAR